MFDGGDLQFYHVGSGIRGTVISVNALIGGDLRFYACAIEPAYGNIAVCQCPGRGDLHFYLDIQMVVYVPEESVNALKGATFISTCQTRSMLSLLAEAVSMP